MPVLYPSPACSVLRSTKWAWLPLAGVAVTIMLNLPVPFTACSRNASSAGEPFRFTVEFSVMGKLVSVPTGTSFEASVAPSGRRDTVPLRAVRVFVPSEVLTCVTVRSSDSNESESIEPLCCWISACCEKSTGKVCEKVPLATGTSIWNDRGMSKLRLMTQPARPSTRAIGKARRARTLVVSIWNPREWKNEGSLPRPWEGLNLRASASLWARGVLGAALEGPPGRRAATPAFMGSRLRHIAALIEAFPSLCRLTHLPLPIDFAGNSGQERAARHTRFFHAEGHRALPFRQRPPLLGHRDRVRPALAGGRPLLAPQQSDRREGDDLRVRREAHRAGLVQLQSALLPDRSRVRDLRGGVGLPGPRLRRLPPLHRERPGPARLRRDLRLR